MFIWKQKSSTEINSQVLLIQYIALLGFYWIATACLFTFASIYLAAKGFDGSQVGVTLAVGSFLGVVLQPIVSSFADRFTNVTPQMLLAILLMISIGLILAMYMLPNVFGLIFLLFAVASAISSCQQPLTHSISMYYLNHGIEIDFGIARGLGSVFFAATSSTVGVVISRFGAEVLPLGSTFFHVITLLVVCGMPLVIVAKSRSDGDSTEFATNGSESKHLLISKKLKKGTPTDVERNHKDSELEEDRKQAVWMIFFKYKRFTLVLLAALLCSVFHTTHNTYMIYIAEKCGGDASTVGIALGLAAAMEVPVMLLFSRIANKISVHKLMKISSVFFLLKAIGLTFASNIPTLYLVSLIQIGSYGLFVPSYVYYTNGAVGEEDKYTGQAAMTAAITLGGMVGNLVGGFIVEGFGVTAMNVFGVGITAIGTLLMLVFA